MKKGKVLFLLASQLVGLARVDSGSNECRSCSLSRGHVGGLRLVVPEAARKGGQGLGTQDPSGWGK